MPSALQRINDHDFIKWSMLAFHCNFIQVNVSAGHNKKRTIAQNRKDGAFWISLHGELFPKFTLSSDANLGYENIQLDFGDNF